MAEYDIRHFEQIARKLGDIGTQLAAEHGQEAYTWDELGKEEQNFFIEVVRKAVNDKIIVPGPFLFPRP